LYPDESIRTEHVGQIFARYAQTIVVRRAVSQYDGIVHAQQFGHGYVAADFDISEIPHPFVRQRTFVGLGDAFGFLMIRRNAAADEAEGRGQALDHVDPAVGKFVQQSLYGIHPAGTRSDDRDGTTHCEAFIRTLTFPCLCGIELRPS